MGLDALAFHLCPPSPKKYNRIKVSESHNIELTSYTYFKPNPGLFINLTAQQLFHDVNHALIIVTIVLKGHLTIVNSSPEGGHLSCTSKMYEVWTVIKDT